MTIRFSEAIEALKAGKKIARYTWQGYCPKYLYLVQGSTFAVNRPPLTEHLPEGTEINYQPHVDALYEIEFGNEKKYVARVYSISNGDIMSDSWYIVE